MQTIARTIIRKHYNIICYSTNSKQSTFDATSSANSSSKPSFSAQTQKLREDFKKAKTDQQVKNWIESKPTISKFKESVEKEKTRLFVTVFKV